MSGYVADLVAEDQRRAAHRLAAQAEEALASYDPWAGLGDWGDPEPQADPDPVPTSH